jgi:hypothetical protein
MVMLEPTAEHVIVRFRWDDDEGDDWIEGDGLLDPLLAARGELATGDLRLLYLGSSWASLMRTMRTWRTRPSPRSRRG